MRSRYAPALRVGRNTRKFRSSIWRRSFTPAQELALAMTFQERMGQLKGKKLCLTWSPSRISSSHRKAAARSPRRSPAPPS